MRHFVNHALSDLTTIRIGGVAADLYFPENIAELKELLAGRPNAVVVGGGSNLVLGDFPDAPVVCLRQLGGQEPRRETAGGAAGASEKVALSVGAGFPLPRHRRRGARDERRDAPGRVRRRGDGGGIMAAGRGNARGRGGGIEFRLPLLGLASGRGFGANGSAFRAPRALPRARPGSAARGGAGGAGSAGLGKNPLPQLRQRLSQPPGRQRRAAAGGGGDSQGALQVSPVHANFFENHGGATAADFVALLARARDRVREKIGVELTPEVKVLGQA